MTTHPLTVALILAALGVGLLGPRRTGRRSSGHRTRSELPSDSPSAGTGKAGPRQPRSGSTDSGQDAVPAGFASAGARIGSALVTWLATALLLGGWPGIALGAVAGLGVERAVRRLEPASLARRRARRAAELPIVLDLLAVCLRTGTPLVTSFEVVASALPGALADDLRVVAALQRLGATATAAWADHAADPVLRPVAEAVARSAESGSRLADSFERLAADCRGDLAIDGEMRARRAGVLAMAPLGLCFLPSFVCLGVVPLVLSITAAVLESVR
jgi:Flp pilus assembly protein TadB